MNQTKEELLEQENQKLHNQLKDKEIDLLRDKVELYTNHVSAQKTTINEYQGIIIELKKTIKRQKAYIDNSANYTFTLEFSISDLERKLAEKETILEHQSKDLEQKAKVNENLKALLASKDKEGEEDYRFRI